MDTGWLCVTQSIVCTDFLWLCFFIVYMWKVYSNQVIANIAIIVGSGHNRSQFSWTHLGQNPWASAPSECDPVLWDCSRYTARFVWCHRYSMCIVHVVGVWMQFWVFILVTRYTHAHHMPHRLCVRHMMHMRTYRIAGNFRGVQFLRKGNLQKFRSLIFANSRPRTAPSTIPGWLCLLPHACAGSTQPRCLWMIGYRCRKNGRRVAYDQDYGLWLSHVQGNLVCCCWRRAIEVENYHNLFAVAVVRQGVRNHRSRPKKDIVSMFYGLFFVDQNSQTLRFRSLASLVHLYGLRWNCRR